MSAAARPRSGGAGSAAGAAEVPVAPRRRRPGAVVEPAPVERRIGAGRPAGSSPTRRSSCGSGRQSGRAMGRTGGAFGSRGRRRAGLRGVAGGAPAPGCRHTAQVDPGPLAVRRARGLVLRSVLARIRVFLRVERPVGAARRAIPARPAPVGLERAGVGAVVRGRAEGRLVGRATLRPSRPAAGLPAPDPGAVRTIGGGDRSRRRERPAADLVRRSALPPGLAVRRRRSPGRGAGPAREPGRARALARWRRAPRPPP